VSVELEVNGVSRSVSVPPRWTLADVLREKVGLTGTHLGCEHGVCGACTVLLDDEPVRACLMLAVQADGHRVRTVEGLAQDGALHPIQKAFRKRHALQCGFCTPGFLMLAASLLEQEPEATPERVKERMSANLCRCTGYKPILEAVATAQAEIAGGSPSDDPATTTTPS
jgi:carbon-monoxide dehydrogenase small subunit